VGPGVDIDSRRQDCGNSYSTKKAHIVVSINTQYKLSSDKRSAAADQKKDGFDIHAGSQAILDVLSTTQKCESGGSN